MDKDALIHEIGSRLVQDIGTRKEKWAHLVLVGKVEGDDPEMTGFAYEKTGEYESVSPHDFEILEALVQLRKAMATADNTAPWRACLIRIDRGTEQIAFEFEYENADRWRIDFRNVDERAKELVP